jgi:hypothetical protein
LEIFRKFLGFEKHFEKTILEDSHGRTKTLLGHGYGNKTKHTGDERDPVEEVEEADRLSLSCCSLLEITAE